MHGLWGVDPMVVRLLVRRGANINERDICGMTVLGRAIKYPGPNAEDNIALLKRIGAR